MAAEAKETVNVLIGDASDQAPTIKDTTGAAELPAPKLTVRKRVMSPEEQKLNENLNGLKELLISQHEEQERLKGELSQEEDFFQKECLERMIKGNTLLIETTQKGIVLIQKAILELLDHQASAELRRIQALSGIVEPTPNTWASRAKKNSGFKPLTHEIEGTGPLYQPPVSQEDKTGSGVSNRRTKECNNGLACPREAKKPGSCDFSHEAEKGKPFFVPINANVCEFWGKGWCKFTNTDECALTQGYEIHDNGRKIHATQENLVAELKKTQDYIDSWEPKP